MTASNANIFQGPTGVLPVVNAQGQLYEEVQVATAGQTVFTLATFAYTPGTRSIFVLKNGIELRRAVGYVETDTTHVTLAAGATAGDVITFKAFAVSQTLSPLQNNGVIPAGTSGQVLAKSSGSDYALKWLDLSSIATLLDQPVQDVASAPTVDVTPYAAVTRNLRITGTTQIDGWAITNGQVFLVKFASSLTLSNNINQVTPTGAAIKVGPNDSCLVRATAANTVEILSFSKSTAVVPPLYNDHRLTLSSGNPIPTGDLTATTLYYTSYRGNNSSLFNGTAWVVRQFTEISIALAGLTIGRPYDVFVYDNAGTATLELLAWFSTTARATTISRQDGVYVKTSDTTRKYVGTVVPTAANVIEDSARQRLVWNMYNRVQRQLRVAELAASWVYTSTVSRQANANANNQVNVVAGLAEDNISLICTNSASNTVAGASIVCGIGLNSTGPAFAGNCTFGQPATPAGGYNVQSNARYNDLNQLGYAFYSWMESTSAVGATTWLGQGNSGIAGQTLA
jgi:hypothetical protein